MTDFRRPSDEAADRAIDGAVREIMSADPGPGFRHRVMRRLSEPEPRRRRWMQHGLATAAVAVLLALAIWIRPAPSPDPPNLARAPESPVRATPPVPREQPTAPPVRPPTRPSSPAAERPQFAKTIIAPGDQIVRAASLPDERGENDPARADRLESTDRLSVPAIAQPGSAIPPIALDPIVIKDIAVAPIPAVRR
jgi:hypothetical protein